MSLEKPETIARFALNERLYSLPADFYANYLKSIDKVTTSDVSAAAKAYILPNQSRIFVAGKGSEIADGLEKFIKIDLDEVVKAIKDAAAKKGKK